MFVDIETTDGQITVNLNNILFERMREDYFEPKLTILGHKDYWCKQPGMYETWEHKSYDYDVTWKEYNRIRALMGLPPEHERGCDIDNAWGSCECLYEDISLIQRRHLKEIEEMACKYISEHPPKFEDINEN